MTRVLFRVALSTLCFAGLVIDASAQTLFVETFEADLSRWLGKTDGSHQGVIVSDPLRPANQVLTFTGPNSAGDVFGPRISIQPGRRLILSFEYLGVPSSGGIPDNLGGAIGFSEDTPGRHRWLAATVMCCGIESAPLLDDGRWRSYSIVFDVFECGLPEQVFCFTGAEPPTDNAIRVMLEDFEGSVAGDVFFDNIQVSVMPLSVDIDIKPGSSLNSLNPNSNGKIPVAILMTESFDASTVNPRTIRFGEGLGGGAPTHFAVQDVDGDDDLDLVLHVNTRTTGIRCGDTAASLTGKTFAGDSIVGVDSVRTVGCR